jgi:hypothetical protein
MAKQPDPWILNAMLSRTPQRIERILRGIAAGCVPFCAGGLVTIAGAFPTAFRGSTGVLVTGIVWYSALLVILAKTYYDLLRRFRGRLAIGKAINPWVACFILNALWISRTLSSGPFSTNVSTLIILVSATVSMILAGAGLAFEFRLLRSRARPS